ncbi:AMP-binding protein [Rhodococcus hoagii]|nr:AMP-binding protein [Prescottella equi]
MAFFVPTLMRGGSLVLGRRSSRRRARGDREDKIHLDHVGAHHDYMLLDHPDLETRNVLELQTLFYGAAAMSPSRLQEGIAKLGPIFFQYFGPERVRHDDHRHAQGGARPGERRATRVVRPPRAVLDVRLLDDDLNEVAQGELGEICVRGALVMKEYWRKPQETAEALRGGWLPR